jgi:hypothetical protein
MSNESKKNDPETTAHCSRCVNEIDGPDAALQQEERPAARRGLSLDSWAVLLALAAAALVKLHILNSVTW